MADRSVALPVDKPIPTQTRAKNPLPCYVILVHGVNDVGEAYPDQEKGLCMGLNDRLDRLDDMKPYDYEVPARSAEVKPAYEGIPAHDEPVKPDPDKVYYRRKANPDSYSPVIPFYWGFRERDEWIQKDSDTWHGQFLDHYNNRLDKNGAKNGGPFVNASNCLPHMWGPGWKPPIGGPTTMNTLKNLKEDKTHPFLEAGERRYQVLAALRLAMVVRILRKRHPRAAINVVAHSMGCLVALLAQVFLLEKGQAPIDTLILNNPPYSFEEMVLDWQLYGSSNQTHRARIETFKRIIRAAHEKRAVSPSLDEILDREKTRGLSGLKRGTKRDYGKGKVITFPERDNRGKTYLYFTPHDQTVALFNQQGIGWQGVPDRYAAEWVERGSLPGTPYNKPVVKKHRVPWESLLDDLHQKGFRQRIFLAQSRGGKAFQVGLAPQHVAAWLEGDHWPHWFHKLGGMKELRKSLPKEAMRRINGEELFPPIDYSPGPERLPISPIDAAVALTNEGSKELWLEVEDPRPRDQRRSDARPGVRWDEEGRRSREAPYLDQEECEKVRQGLNRGKSKEDSIPAIKRCQEIVKDERYTGRLNVLHKETPNQTRQRLQSYGWMDNSFHSSIVSNDWHSQAVTAFDLALGQPIPWTRTEKDFYDYVCEVADWRIMTKQDNPSVEDKIGALRTTGFWDGSAAREGKPAKRREEEEFRALIKATAEYYVFGVLPLQVESAGKPSEKPLIYFEMTGHRHV